VKNGINMLLIYYDTSSKYFSCHVIFLIVLFLLEEVNYI